MRLIKTFLINGIILTLTSLVLRCISMFFNSYISQKIGSEAVGLYGLVMSIYGFAITIALSGINLATTKIVAEEIAIGNIGNIKKVVRKCLIFSIFFSCLGSFLLITFAPFICKTWLHNKISSVPFYIISISLPFISMSSCLTRIFFCSTKHHKACIWPNTRAIAKSNLNLPIFRLLYALWTRIYLYIINTWKYNFWNNFIFLYIHIIQIWQKKISLIQANKFIFWKKNTKNNNTSWFNLLYSFRFINHKANTNPTRFWKKW